MKKTNFTLIAVLMALFSSSQVMAQVPNDSIVADFNEFVRLLEETHPDPYTNYGGRPFFRQAAMETRFDLIEDSVTNIDELANRIRQFLVPLRDGHTNIATDYSSSFNDREIQKGAAISFWPISDGVIIDVIDNNYKNLLGSRLIAIENIPFKKICEDLAQYVSAENEIGRISNFCFISGLSPNKLRKAIPDMRDDSITFQILSPEGKPMDLTMPIVQKYGGNEEQLAFIEWKEPFPNLNNMGYLFVDEKKNTMYFRSSHIMAREVLEYMHSNAMDMGEQLKKMYRSYNDETMPDNEEEALAKIPSFSEVFEKMLLEMKKNKSKNLIIDLRGNGGGFTPITIPTLYQMWGDKYFEKAPTFGIKFFRLLSPLYLQKMNISMEQFSSITGDLPIMLGDYLSDDDTPQELNDENRNMIIDNMMCSIKDHLKAQQGKPVYTPEHVYVLINPTTFSAAFHYMFYLWKMGATVVGIPCKQAPNTYMEVTPFELPRTKLSGSISNSLQLFLPVDDPRAEQFTPDLMPTYEDYKRYNFDHNTELLFLLDYIKNHQ